jgi:kynurenine 3-monooxygenase
MDRQFDGQKIVIIGAGLVGTLGAILFARRGAHVVVIERQAQDKIRGFGNRRSFNITVSSRGKAALETAGVWEKIEQATIPVTGRMCHEGESTEAFPYSPDLDLVLHAARRSDVNAKLLEAASGFEGITFRFGWTVSDLDKVTGAIRIAPIDNPQAEETIADADFVIGADGINSTVRRLIHKDERADFAQRFLNWSYRELRIEPASSTENPWRMDPNSLHIWPRGNVMMFALPNPDGSFAGNFIYPLEDEADFDIPGRIETVLQRDFPDVLRLVPDAAERLRATPPSYFPTQRNSKWFHGSKFVLVGDAAHATVPFYGQGMNSGFESMVELIRCLEANGSHDRTRAFETYQRNRKCHTDAVADLSIENFDELRENFRHVVPQARRRVEVLLHRLFPKLYVPLHIKVSHSLTGYRTALDECARRDRILRFFGFDIFVYGFAAASYIGRGGTRMCEAIFGRNTQKNNPVAGHSVVLGDHTRSPAE